MVYGWCGDEQRTLLRGGETGDSDGALVECVCCCCGFMVLCAVGLVVAGRCGFFVAFVAYLSAPSWVFNEQQQMYNYIRQDYWRYEVGAGLVVTNNCYLIVGFN